MKKIISSVIACIMLIGIMAPCCIASEQTAYGDKVTFYSPNISVNAGEDFVFEVNVRDNPGFCTYFIMLEYDNTVLDVTSQTEAERLVADNVFITNIFVNEKYSDNCVTVMGLDTENHFEDGNVFGFRFTVKEDAGQKKTSVKVILKEIIHYDDNGGTYDAFDLFDGSAPSYEADVLINSDEEYEEISGGEFGCLTETEFADTYEERLAALQTPKPTPKPIYATPRPEKTDSAESGSNVSSTLKKIEVTLKENVTGYMEPTYEDKFEPDRAAVRYEAASALYAVFNIENAEDRDDFSDVSEEYKKAVNELAQAGIINGYEDKTFGGEKNITRAEFVKLLTTAFNIEYKNSENSSLSDIEGHWAESYIKAFVNEGYILGYPDGSFKPDANITRAEMAVVMNRVLKIDAVETAEVKFSDLTEEHWAFLYISAIFK